jgi:hypothetical protein
MDMLNGVETSMNDAGRFGLRATGVIPGIFCRGQYEGKNLRDLLCLRIILCKGLVLSKSTLLFAIPEVSPKSSILHCCFEL